MIQAALDRLGSRVDTLLVEEDPRNPLANGLRRRDEAAELEAGESDAARRAHEAEAEVAEEVGGEDRLVDVEALVRRLALGVAVGERLDRLRAALARLADRGEEERLQHPGTRLVTEVGAGDEHRVVRRRAAGKLVGARKER